MVAQVKWNKKALAQLQAALRYGESAFGVEVARRFYRQVIDNEPRLAANPELGALEPLLEGCNKEYRSLVVHEHYKLIYYTNQKRTVIHIAILWDTRQQPAALTDRIK